MDCISPELYNAFVGTIIPLLLLFQTGSETVV